MSSENRSRLKEKKRIVIKVGSSTITHPETGAINLGKIEQLVRHIGDLKGMGKEVILVSSGAIAAGRQAIAYREKARNLAEKQAFAAIGQARLMMVYQRLFAEYNMTAAQILLTQFTFLREEARTNARNTFDELISTSEIRLGDNDRLSALVSSLTNADLLILLSDIDGLYTDDPNRNPDAKFISTVTEITPSLLHMGKESSSSDVGTGGMQTKLKAAQIACKSGADMIIASGDDLTVIDRIVKGEEVGTLFEASRVADFDFEAYIHGSENE